MDLDVTLDLFVFERLLTNLYELANIFGNRGRGEANKSVLMIVEINPYSRVW